MYKFQFYTFENWQRMSVESCDSTVKIKQVKF